MNDSDILISLDADTNFISEPLSTYLMDNNYTVTHNNTDDYWAWIPIITQSERRTLVDWFGMMQNENIIIIPILLQDTHCPTAFSARMTVDIADDTGELSPYFDSLKEHLSNAQQLLNKLNKLKADYQDYDAYLKKSPHQVNLRPYLKDLQDQMTATRHAMISPRALYDDNQEAVTRGIRASLYYQHLMRQADNDPSRIFGDTPQTLPTILKGRDIDIARTCNALFDEDAQTKLVSIVGRGGTGKTAVACHTLELLSKHNRIEKTIFLNARNRNQPLTLERLFEMTGEALGDNLRETLNTLWQNKQIRLETRIDALIDQYQDIACLLVLDSLEDKLTLDGQFEDPELRLFVQQFLSREHQSKILATSRLPLTFDDDMIKKTKVVPLSMGLCPRTALQMLRDLDKDDTLGLKDADPALVPEIIERTKAYPRALEAIVGILVNRPLMSLYELIDFIPHLDDEVLLADWVERAEEVLDADQRMVMQALSIFQAPVNATAIQFLLAPYLETTGIDIALTLERLRRGRYIIRNNITGSLNIHPLDKDYNYTLIKDDHTNAGDISIGERFLRQMNILPPASDESSQDLFTRLILESRAGDYYELLRGQADDWKSIHDLQPYFLEYGHRLRATDYNTAFTMLITIYNLLKLSGFSRKIVDMILPLIDFLSVSYKVTSYNMLGMAYDDLGQYQDALNCHLSALPLTRIEGNQPSEAAHLSGIGLQYSNLGDYDQALDYYEQALTIARELGNRKQERGILNNIAVVYNSIGRKLEGLSTYEESLNIAREIDDKQGIAVTLANIGDSYGALGNVDKTIECYQEAIDLYATIGDKLGRGVTIGKMGNAATMLGSYDDALKLLDVAVEIAQTVGNRMWEVLHKADIAAVYAHEDELDKALGLLETIMPEAEEVGTPIVMNYIHSLLAGLFLYSGQLEKANFESELAIQYTNPSNQHYEYALYGLIQLRLDKVQEARNAFNRSLDHAAELLENTPNLYSPKYSRGLALMGLAIVTNDLTYAEDSKQAYIEARENCNAKGIVSREMKKLNMLTHGRDNDDDSIFLDELEDE